MKGDAGFGWQLVKIFGIIIGIGAIIGVFGYLSIMLSGVCWTNVNEPFQAMRFDKDIELHLNPQCVDKIVMTSNEASCRDACARDDDCRDECFKAGSPKTFFIIVKKEEGYWGIFKNFIKDPGGYTVRYLQQKYFEKNQIYSMLCDLENDFLPMEFVADESSRCEVIRITREGDICVIQEKGECRHG